MEQPQQSCHGKAASWPLPRRLAEGILEGRRIRHRAPRAIHEERPVPMPSPIVQGGPVYRATETLSEEVKAAQRESGTGLTGGRRAEPQARQMRHMAARGIAVQNLSQEALDGRDRRQHAVAP